MTRVNWRTVVAIARATSSLLVSAAASAHDDERWEHERERERFEHRHYYAPSEHWHRYSEAPRVVYERRPVMVMPAPIYQAPVYAPPMDPSLNFNFTIPLR
jgi:Ni/Co efflux regulator RcnB